MNQFTELVPLMESLLKLSMIVMVGLYFTFSNTVMKTLSAFKNGNEVMVALNQVILNPMFMVFFILSGVAGLYFVFMGSELMKLSGAIFVLGTTLVTVIKNVPLNNKLLGSNSPKLRQQVWREYLQKWVFWNHVRTVSALVSAFLIVL